MKKKYQNNPYEFLFLINGNPIVGRNFPIKNYNRESLISSELRETIDDAAGLIKKHFKNNTYEFMEKINHYFVASTDENVETKDIYENEDFFTLQIKVNGRVVCETIFSGNDYPPSVRYDVNIRKIIPEIIDYIQRGLSRKNYTKNLCGYQLDSIFINN